MNSQQWQQVKELFEAALEHVQPARGAFLSEACPDDDEVRAEVQSLLAAHERDSGFMNEPIGNLILEDKPVLHPGQRLGNYEVTAPLGKGGMGQVYLAVDTRLRRQVAIKLLPSSYTNDSDRVMRFEQEAQTASALNHPNIVTIHEIGQAESLHFISTEFIDGTTLREHLNKTRMPVAEVLDVATQVAFALQAAHDAGIIHRDIKPENLMLRRDGIVKVLDFGLAKLGSQDLPAVQPSVRSWSTVDTNAGVVMGTVGYMSPEQARGEEVDVRTDIWSLGVVLYEMTAGRAPFAGATASHLLASMLESQPPPLSLDLEVPAELERIITKALSKNTAERYQTARDLAVDLKNLRSELEVQVRLKRTLDSNPAMSNATPRVLDTTHNLVARTNESFPARPITRVGFILRELSRRKALAGAAFVVLVIAAGWTYFAVKAGRFGSSATGNKSIAILPLKPIKEADGGDVYQIGIADSLIHRVGSMNGFSVKSLGAIQKYAGTEQDPITVGKEQKVDYVLAANYQLADGRISVTAQLFNVETGVMEGSYRIERDSSSVFAMQDAIALEIGNKLSTHFGATSNPQTAKRGTTNEEAYRLYLQGMYLANLRNLEDCLKAIQALEQAVALDPNYARAWAGLGYAHRTLSNYRYSASTQETYQKSIGAINKALSLDQNLSEAHSALCENKYLFEWDFAGAEMECKLAIQLDPNSSQAHEIYSRYLMGRGRHEEAIAEIKTAIDLEPTSKFNQHIFGRVLFCARRFKEAEDQFKRVIAMDQNYGASYSWLTSTLALQRKDAEAFDWFIKLLSIRKVEEETVQVFKSAFQTSGWHGVWREWVIRSDKLGGSVFERGAYSAQIGDKDKAFDYLEKVYQRREIWNTYLRVDPRLDPIRDDPRFHELLQRVESR
jgi:eukaryotic-like serine/threonine-protein kinase